MATSKSTTSHRQRGSQERMLRIIAGQWRSRRFRFPPLDIRPTPDRVRETLFNWLQERTEGARCLDLFAGSGALGLEALSRGAASVLFVEQQREATRALEQLLADWQAQGGGVICDQVEHFLTQRHWIPKPAETATAGGGGFNLVFIDPPYAATVLPQVLQALTRGWLAPNARVYVERARTAEAAIWPPAWRELRAGTAGEVGYHLLAPAEGQGQT